MAPLSIDIETFATYCDALQTAALATTRLAATSLPADLPFHRSVDPALARDIDAFSGRVLSLASKLVGTASGQVSRMREEEDVVDEFVRNIVDPMEGMLESTDGALDVFLGKRKDPAIPIPVVPFDPHRNKSKKQTFRGRLDPALTHASHILKPQLLFKHTLSNTDESPYIPTTLIPHKWCAKVPLGYVFHDEKSNKSIEDEDDEEESRKRTLHPYYYELTHPAYPDHVFNPLVEPSLPSPLDSGSPINLHPLTFISTPEALLSMANIISSETELAVDLEHHSYRSCKGFLALMQISTRQGDFVVDLLVPEVREGLRQAKDKNVRDSEDARIANEAGQIIARVFTDPSIIKVFHGAESDVMWLQQDFNIFVVGLFDTFHASKLLEFPKHSLAYLLETYCDLTPDKRYQLADWRIRPLPIEMLAYARSDTHFLLYIYDMLRLSLIERSITPAVPDEHCALLGTNQTNSSRGLIHSVLTRSSRTALKLYETEVYDTVGGTGSNGWDTLARKWNKIALVGSPSKMQGTEVQELQTAVYKAVHRWREDVAREEDESTRYVLSTHHLFLLAERVPTTIPDLLSLFGGPRGVNGSVPPVLKRRVGELAMVIKTSMEASRPRSSPRGSAEAEKKGAETVLSVAVEESETMGSSMPPSSVAKPTHESRLWTSTSTATISMSRSSFFGAGILGDRTQENGLVRPSSDDEKGIHSAARGVLFGSTFVDATTVSSSSTTRTTLTHARLSTDSTKRFKDIVERIHKTLVVAPVASMSSFATSVRTQVLRSSHSGVPTSIGVDSTVPEASDPIPSGPEGQIEIPFVPMHKRQSLSNLHDHQPKDDTIIVVGQAGARQRKRKRDKVKGIISSSQSKSELRLSGAEAISTADCDQEVEEFDYFNVPNLLDDEVMRGHARGVRKEDERIRKKQRHGKGSGSLEYRDFQAPPRDQREVSSGNKTHTFR